MMDKSKQLKRMPSSAALLGRAEEEDNTDDYSQFENVRPFDMSALKARAFRFVCPTLTRSFVRWSHLLYFSEPSSFALFDPSFWLGETFSAAGI